MGHCTLRVEDYGKVAATVVHVESIQALRVAPRLDVRQHAWIYATEKTPLSSYARRLTIDNRGTAVCTIGYFNDNH